MKCGVGTSITISRQLDTFIRSIRRLENKFDTFMSTIRRKTFEIFLKIIIDDIYMTSKIILRHKNTNVIVPKLDIRLPGLECLCMQFLSYNFSNYTANLS